MNRYKEHKFVIPFLLSVLVISACLTTPLYIFPETQKMTLAALGDCIMSRKISVETNPGFLELVKLIRTADCTWANCELPIVEIDNVYPQYREEDIPGASKPWGADQLKWLGIDTVSLANNHIMDFGHEGLFSTQTNLNRVEIAYAGAGKDLDASAKPGYADTPGGRVGLISCASAIHPGTHASYPNAFMRGRPGLNPLRLSDTIYLDNDSYKQLKKISENVYGLYKEAKEKADKLDELPQLKDKDTQKEKKVEQVKFFNTIFQPAEKTAYVWKLNQEDLERITTSVKIAKRNAKIAIVSVHAHRGSYTNDSPAEFLETFARACIDAGADAVFNTGPHRIWGIEIYKNKPIFYSLGNFLFQIYTEEALSSEIYTMLGLDPNTRDTSIAMEKVNSIYFKKDLYWQSFVPIITFEKNNEISSIELYPISLRKGRPDYEQGTPFLADKSEAKVILDELTQLSTPYKTKIENRNGVGIIRLK